MNLAKPYTLGRESLAERFSTTASHGTDQLIVQRLLAARNQRQSALALLSSGVAVFFQFALFLLVGVMLFAYYRVPAAAFGRADRIFPTFIVSRMPHGIAGLLIAAILAAAMSNLSAALNSLSSSSIMDLYFVRADSRADVRTDTRTDVRPALSDAPATPGASHDSFLGAGAVRTGGAGIASHGAGCGSRIADCVGRLRRVAGSVSAGCADPARKSEWGNCRHALRLRDRTVPVGW